jgi:glutathione S-transferase
MLAPESLKRVHPLGKAPVISDGETVVAESGAIIEYLIGEQGDGRLVPEPGSPERRRYTYWLHYAEGSAMPPLLLKLIFDTLPGRLPLPLRPVGWLISQGVKSNFVHPQLKLHLDYVESELSGSTWFAGEMFTGADVQMSFPLEAASARGLLGSSRPNLEAFVERIRERPAYQRAKARIGPQNLGL